MNDQQSTLYPLGRNIFASVRTWRGAVKIYVRHYKAPTDTKGGRAIPTQRGVALEMKELERLMKIKKNLCDDYHQQISSLSATAKNCESGTVKNNGQNQLPLSSPATQDTMGETSVLPTCSDGGYVQQLPQPTPDHSSGIHAVPVYTPCKHILCVCSQVSDRG